ncbi:MAG: type III pantothenate kinase [Balneolaceae bacterium]|nr:type III pantothenate kinase [Balneolaceae bacterium]
MSNFIPQSSTTLFLDIGNSSIKAAYKEGMQWKNPNNVEVTNASELINWINKSQQHFKHVVIASVVPDVTDLIVDRLESATHHILEPSDIPLELLDYKTPKTLGIDRFFACYGAISHTSKAVVVIDSGTACTVDYMSADEIYRGGVIMPGVSVIEKSLRKFTPNLPHVQRFIPKQWPGKSTKQSLQWGISGMVKKSIEGYLSEYESSFDEFDVVLTGGDAEWMASILDYESKVRPMLVFEGMQRYMEYIS